MEHEIGHASPRVMPQVPAREAERELSELAGKPISLSGLVVTTDLETCPARGSTEVEDALRYQIDRLGRGEVHPVVWGDGYGLADT